MSALPVPDGGRAADATAAQPGHPPKAADPDILTVRNLALGIATSARRVTRIDDLGLTLRPGEMQAVVGPSGCGKTSACLALIGWNRPNVQVLGGDVRLLGNALLGTPPDRLKRLWGRDILYVPQSSATALVPSRRVVDQLTAFPGDDRAARQARRRRLGDAFQALGVPGFGESRLAHHFSGGQLQRSLLATVFATRPRLLVIDEPTTALQPSLKTQVMALVKARLSEIGAAALVVTHELDFFRDQVDGVVDLTTHIVSQPDRPAGPAAVGQTGKSVPAPTAVRRHNGPAERTTADHARGASVAADGLTVTAQDGHPIIRDVSFEVRPGTCVALLGPSGAGKTTVLRTILGQHGTASGRIAVDGRDLPLQIRHRRRQQKRWIEYVPQSVRPHLNPALTVGYLVRRRLRQAGRPHTGDQPAEVLAALRLPTHYLDKPVDALSGGECQRLGIALALASAPRILLLDEVTASLDVATAMVVSEALEAIRNDRRSTILLVSHQPALVQRLAEATVELRDGVVVGGADPYRSGAGGAGGPSPPDRTEEARAYP